MWGPRVKYANVIGAIYAPDAFAPRFRCLGFGPSRATNAPAAIAIPIPNDVVKNKMLPAYPMAAAKAAFPNIEIKIMSTKSTTNMAISPIEAVADMPHGRAG